MNAITVNKKIAENIFDDEKFKIELIEALNALIDAELAKSDGEISFELIDIYSEALNKIYDGEDIDKIFISLQTVEEMQDFIKSDKRFTILKRAAKITLAACAVLALTLTANTVAEEATGYNFLEKMAQAVKTVFTGEITDPADKPYSTEPQTEITTEKPPESEAQISEESLAAENVYSQAVPSAEPNSKNSVSVPKPTDKPQIKPQNPNLSEVLSPEEPPTQSQTETTTREPFTRVDEDKTAAPVVIKLNPQYSGNFKRSYKVGENADFSGLTVTAVYDNGTQRQIPISECNVYGFLTDTAANRIVTVEYEGCSFSYLIRVEEAK